MLLTTLAGHRWYFNNASGCRQRYVAYVKLAAIQFQQLRMKEMAKADSKVTAKSEEHGQVVLSSWLFTDLIIKNIIYHCCVVNVLTFGHIFVCRMMQRRKMKPLRLMKPRKLWTVWLLARVRILNLFKLNVLNYIKKSKISVVLNVVILLKMNVLVNNRVFFFRNNRLESVLLWLCVQLRRVARTSYVMQLLRWARWATPSSRFSSTLTSFSFMSNTLSLR